MNRPIAFLLLVLFGLMAVTARAAEVEVTVRSDQDGGKISRHLYGHFAEHLGRCIYDGLWVGPESPIPNTGGVRNDIIAALRKINAPNLRWPGGCFADDYHWRDGIGPVDQRPKRINLHWGHVTEPNSFGTHEFLDLCERIGASPYLAGNVGSGTPQEMRDWLEYLTYDGDSELANLRRKNGRQEPWKIEFFGVGNENWGCGGDMTPEYYADLYKQFAVYLPNYGDNRLFKVACGPGDSSTRWTEVLMRRARNQMHGISIHKYTLAAPWHDKLPATGFSEDKWFDILRDALSIEQVILDNVRVLDQHDPQGRVKLMVDEWGTWYRSEPGTPGYALYQQNTLRDAMVAALSLHIFHEQNRRVAMANIAQTVNVLQALILTEGEQMILTPTYHVFDMLQVHHDATLLPVEFESPKYTFGDQSIPAVSISASRDSEGKLHASLVNTDPHQSHTLTLRLRGVRPTAAKGRILTAEALDAHNTFAEPERLAPGEFAGAKVAQGVLTVELPAKSIVVLSIAE